MVKMKISTKLFITYFIILIITFTVTTISFNFLSHSYLLKEAKQQLREEGKLIADTLKNAPLLEVNIREIILARQKLKIAGRFIDSKIIVLNSNKKIIYSNLERSDRKVLLMLIRQKNKKDIKDFVVQRVPVFSNSKSDVKGEIILLTRIKDIKELNNLFQRTQFLSFIIAGIIALIIGLIFGKSITKPINKLMNTMANFSLKKFSKGLDIRTGDEIEKLAICFNGMANKLKKYDEQQKKFLQNTSHELKTPLMSIQGYAEAIKDGVVEGKEMEESLDIIIEESQRLKKVVEEIIYLTKLENVAETFNFADKNIGQIITKAIKSVKALADEKGIKISCKGNLDYTGKFDEDKLKRAFINILGNCIRYAKSKITIEVSCSTNKLEINIMDDGKGFKNGEEKRVFDRFYKGENGGTGIGLAITKAIIDGHKGEIEAFNNKPTGAIFRIVIPLN